MSVTIGIKALNEEAHIAAALASALAAVKPFGGTVVLADSGSTDKTLEIARTFPGVRIVQLADPRQRSCGTGAQLAFQACDTEYFYLLDGDMVMRPGFLEQGVAFLAAHRDHAAVGGRVIEAETASIEFEMRARIDQVQGSSVAGETDRLDCGGLYRVCAIRALGYFADRNLHSFEEFELGARLIAAGWKLSRIDVPAVDHHGHTLGGYRLLWRRLRSGYAAGPGEVVRASFGQSHFPVVVRRFSQLRNSLAIACWWLALAACLATARPLALFLVILAPVAYFVIRRRGLRLGLYNLASWNASALGLFLGLARRRRAPRAPIPAIEIAPAVRSTRR